MLSHAVPAVLLLTRSFSDIACSLAPPRKALSHFIGPPGRWKHCAYVARVCVLGWVFWDVRWVEVVAFLGEAG